MKQKQHDFCARRRSLVSMKLVFTARCVCLAWTMLSQDVGPSVRLSVWHNNNSRQASRLSGTSRSLVRLRRHICTHSPARRALQQKWRRRARWPTTATCQLNTRFPIAVESHGPLCDDAHGLLRDLGRRLSEFSGDVREVSTDFSCRAAF